MPRPVFSPGASDRLHQLWRRPWNESPVPPDDHQGSLRAEDRSWLERFMDEEISPRIRSVGEALEPYRETYIAPALDLLISDDPEEQVMESLVPGTELVSTGAKLALPLVEQVAALGMMKESNPLRDPAYLREMLDKLRRQIDHLSPGVQRRAAYDLTETHPRVAGAFQHSGGRIAEGSADELEDALGAFYSGWGRRSSAEKARYLRAISKGETPQWTPRPRSLPLDQEFHAEVPFGSSILLTPEPVRELRWAREALEDLPENRERYARALRAGATPDELQEILTDRLMSESGLESYLAIGASIPSHELTHFGQYAADESGILREWLDAYDELEQWTRYRDHLSTRPRKDPRPRYIQRGSWMRPIPEFEHEPLITTRHPGALGLAESRVKELTEKVAYLTHLKELGEHPARDWYAMGHSAFGMSPNKVRRRSGRPVVKNRNKPQRYHRQGAWHGGEHWAKRHAVENPAYWDDILQSGVVPPGVAKPWEEMAEWEQYLYSLIGQADESNLADWSALSF